MDNTLWNNSVGTDIKILTILAHRLTTSEKGRWGLALVGRSVFLQHAEPILVRCGCILRVFGLRWQQPEPPHLPQILEQ